MLVEDIRTKVPEPLFDKLRKEFEEFRPCQEKAIESGLLEKKNMVVCSPTSSGKTVVAEIAVMKNILERRKKAIYIVPLKALAREKWKEFKEAYPKLQVALSIGDKDSADEYLGKYDLIITTSEKLDSLIRHHASWLSQVKCVVVDEIHLLNDKSRGPTLEIVITLLRKVLTAYQFIALSATIGNPWELKDWLEAELIFDEWRPVELFEGVYFDNKIDFYNLKDDIPIEDMKHEVVSLANDTLKKEKQALVFVKSRKEAVTNSERISKISKLQEKKIAEETLNVLGKPTIQCQKLAAVLEKGIAFHHSGLLPQQRTIVEENFRKGKVKIICCTPTLAAGVNLPAFRTIIKDLKRYNGIWGMDWINVLEQKQMAGRAGRPGMEDYGEAICIAKSEPEKDIIFDKFINGDIENIQSKLASQSILRMHILSLISSEFVTSEDDIRDFMKQTFFCNQLEYYSIEPFIDEVLDDLESFDFIERNEKIKSTRIGKRVSELYIDPATAHYLITCIERSKELDFNEYSILHAISNTSELNPYSISKKDSDIIEEAITIYQYHLLQPIPDIDSLDYEQFLAATKLALMFRDWIEEKDEDELFKKYNALPGDIRHKTDLADWLLYSMSEIATLLNVRDILVEVKSLRMRLKYGVKRELLELLQLKNVGRVRSRYMFSNGIKTLKDVKEVDPQQLAKILGPKIAQSLKKQLGEEVIIKKEGQQELPKA